MSKCVSHVGFVALATVFLLVGIFEENGFSAAYQDKSSKPRIIAQIDEDKVTVRRRLGITITLVNDSDESITIYKKIDIGLWLGLMPKIADERGRHYPDTVVGEPPFKGEAGEKIPASNFVTIGPKESFVLKRFINVYNYLEEAAPGRYSMTLYYENPLPPKVIPSGIHVWSVPPGSIKTEPLYFDLER